MHIPSGYFKDIAIRRNSRLAIAAFIMCRDTDFCTTQVAIDEIKTRSGLDIFPVIPKSDRVKRLGVPGCP